MGSKEEQSATALIGKNLPHLRRYGRALMGSQTSGDRFAAATLEALLEDLSVVADAADPKVALFKTFHRLWSSAGAPLGAADTPLSARAQQHMVTLTPNSREALLLHVIEGFTAEQISDILDSDPDDLAKLIAIAIDRRRGDHCR
jgi:DNA-directed RNA polymerase specialized sigma24 family protein